MKATAWLVMALVGTAFVASPAIAADNKELIVGKWSPEEAKGKGVNAVIEFSKDGTLKITVSGDGLDLKIDGKYKLVDEKTIEMTITPPGKKEEGKTEKMTIKSLSADKLVITNPQGKDETFMKVK